MMLDLVETLGNTRRHWLSCLVLAAAMWAVPQVASAQAIAGTIKDTSGSVLPGVTIEASSPVLIEKTRTAISDGAGQYRIENLAPGVYTVTYTLTGFAVVQRAAVDIQSGVTVTLNTELRVGAVAETITVTGETPVVDIQNSTRVQKVLDDALVSALPATRGYGNLLATVPGIQATGLANTGTAPAMNFFTSRGGRSNEGTLQIDGMNVGSAFNGGGVSSYAYDTSNSAEVQITIAGGLGETDRGGPQFNLVPKTGGNTFSGTYFGSIAGEWSQGSNLDDTLRSYGIADPATLFKSWDTSFAMGGPIMKDKIWFYAVTRTLGAYTGIANFYANANAGDVTKWSYVADKSIQERNANSQKVLGSRFTVQATPRNKFSFYYDYQKDCQGGAFTQDSGGCRSRGDDWVAVGAFGTWAPEAAHMWDDREKITQASWSSPVTSRLLLEAGFSQYVSNWGGQTPPGALDATPFIPVLEQSAVGTGVPVANFIYHGFAGLGNNYQSHNVWRASGTYVTGAHSLKVGYSAAYEVTNLFGNYASHGLQYRFNNGVPNQLTQRITPWQQGNRTRYDGFYAQDQYTVKRLTLQGAVRYEHAWSFFPEGQSGLLADSVFGGKAYTLPAAKGVKGYNDIAPRMGMAYDIFGTGRTAIKVNLAKYLADGQQRRPVPDGQPRRHVHPDDDPLVGGRQPELHAGLQPQQPRGPGQPGVGRRPVRRVGRAELRIDRDGDRAEPGRARRLGYPSLRLAVCRVGAAADHAARFGGNRLQPAVVGQLLLHRQPRHRPGGLRHDDVQGAEQCQSPERRTERLLPAAQGFGVRQGGQLLHVCQRLRRRRLPLAGR